MTSPPAAAHVPIGEQRLRPRLPRRVRRAAVAVALAVGILVFLRWLSFALWQFDDAAPLPARATPTAPIEDPILERELDGDLTLSKFRYSIHGTRLNVIHRPDDDTLRPTLLLVNGGAWKNEDEDADLWFAEGWARDGYTVVTITHRPSHDAPFPGPTEDVMAGVGYALALGDDYDIDPTRLAIFGGSSGGHLASYTAYRLAEVHPDAAVLAVATAFGPTDLRYIADDGWGGTWYRVATLVYTPEVDATEDVNLFLGCNILRRDCRDPIVQASPITYVSPQAPPTLIIHGKRDDTVPWFQAERLADALSRAGVDVRLIIDEDMGHELDPRYLDDITAFLDEHLR